MRNLIIGFASLAALGTAMPAAAATVVNQDMTVTLNVANTCTLAVNNLTFNANFIGGTAVDAQSSAVAKCTKDTAYNVTFGDGANVASGQRNMKNGTVLVPYNLYSDSGRTAALSSSTQIPGTGTGSDQTINVYGRIPASAAAVAAGQYTDTVTVTLTY
ncbi:spore coat U domain-containing protein [Parablastomonas sp. CN1-191]|uniref:Csu type fimbrial protein n=1 Tax=Parablastomonas sp. CN1-191 TaxID=3400908 RepID=UPI003BF918BB